MTSANRLTTSVLVSYVRPTLSTNDMANPATGNSTAKTEVDRPRVMSEVSLVAAELRRIRLARRRGANAVARRRLDRLIDYVWGSGPEDAA